MLCRIDGFRWRCPHRKACGKHVNLRKGTFFAKSKLQLWQILGFLVFWVQSVCLNVICKEVEINYKTGVDWASFCREVVFDAMITKSEKIGGEGRIVEIDESKFGKRKYHRGHYVEGQWVFGGFERGTGRVFMIPVENRSSATLIPVIENWILPGTTVISDFWKAYDCLNDEGYKHLKV